MSGGARRAGALEAEIARLQGENAALKKELHRAQSAAARRCQARSSGCQRGPPRLQLPSDADLNKVVTFIEKVWRRLVEMIVTLQKDVLNKT